MLQFEVEPDKVEKVCPNRPAKPAPVQKPRPKPVESVDQPEDTHGTSA